MLMPCKRAGRKEDEPVRRMMVALAVRMRACVADGTVEQVRRRSDAMRRMMVVLGWGSRTAIS